MIGFVDILGVSGQRRPAERPDTATKQRPDIGGHKSGKIKGVCQAFFQRHLADIIAVIQRRNPGFPEVNHRCYLNFHAGARSFFDVFWRVFASFAPLCHAPPLRQIAIGWVVGAGLVGYDVWPNATSDQFGKDIGGIAQQPHRFCLTGFGPLPDHIEGLVKCLCPLVDVFCAQSKIDTVRIAFNGQTAGPGHHRGKRLCTTHTAQTAGENPFAFEVAVIVLPTCFDEGFIGPLHDALTADIDP